MRNYVFKSARLGFRNWLDEDIPTFAAMNMDDDVMEFFPNKLTYEETAASVARFRAHYEREGFTFYAVDTLSDGVFAGFIGLNVPDFEADFVPRVEIGWRLRKAVWGQGLATEGAKRCLEYGFEVLGFEEIHAFAVRTNVRSERVMQKIGMSKIGEFDHPNIDAATGMKTLILYKITAPSESKIS